MSNTYLVFVLLLFGLMVQAQEKFSEVYALSTEIESIEMIRIASGNDLLESLNEVIDDKY